MRNKLPYEFDLLFDIKTFEALDSVLTGERFDPHDDHLFLMAMEYHIETDGTKFYQEHRLQARVDDLEVLASRLGKYL